MKRPFWMAVGAAFGVGGTLWAERQVRRRLRKASEAVGPLSGTEGWAAAAREAQGRLMAAARAGASERRRREEELWARLDERRTGGPRRVGAERPHVRAAPRPGGHGRARR